MAVDPNDVVQVPIEERFAAALDFREDAPAKEPEAKPEAEAPAAEKPEISVGEQALLDEIKGLQAQFEDLKGFKAETTRETGKQKDDDFLALQAKEVDPETGAPTKAAMLAQRLQTAEQRLAAREEHDERVAAAASETQLQQEQIEAVKNYGLTRQEFKDAMDWWDQQVARDQRMAVLSFDEVLARAYGSDRMAARRAEITASRTKGANGTAPAGRGPAPAKIVDTTATGSPAPARAKRGPEPGADFHQTKGKVLAEVFGIQPD